MVQWAYFISFSYSIRFHALKPRVFWHIELFTGNNTRLDLLWICACNSEVNVKIEGDCHHREWNVHLNKWLMFFFPFDLSSFVFRMGPQKGETAQNSTVFSIFSQMDSWLFTLCYETLSHYWFAFTVSIKRLSVTIGIIQLVISLPMKGIQVLITHSQQSINIYFKKNQKRCFIYLFTRYLGPYCYYFKRKKRLNIFI